jgi:trimeric autotransporter adhesin
MRLIKSTPKGKQRVYDIEVADVHNFYANGVNVHNCATDGGVSVIKDDGTVISRSHSYGGSMRIDVNNSLLLATHNGRTGGQNAEVIDLLTLLQIGDKNPSPIHADNDVGTNENDYGYGVNSGANYMPFQLPDFGSTINPLLKGLDLYFGRYFLIHLYEERNAPANTMSNFITTTYNTGWMHGNCKGAFLSDTDATDVTGTELVINGTFDSNANGWSVPLGSTSTLTYNATDDDIDLVRNNEGCVETDAAITLEVGKTYVLTWELKYTSNGSNGYVYFGMTGMTSTPTTAEYRGIGVKTHTFTATDTGGKLLINSGGVGGLQFTLDNISLRLAEEDRSVNNKGLQVFGTITKTPVATGADLVAYSGFSGSNYLEQPYNSALNFGTGPFSMTIWCKSPAGAGTYVLYSWRGSSGTLPFWQTYFGDNLTVFDIQDSSSNNGGFSINRSLKDNVWHLLTVVQRNSSLREFYIDGILVGTNTTTIVSLTSTAHELRVGIHYDGLYAYNGSLALFRVSASAPSPEQIKKIYEDEKVLFQENAKCTLYGASDAVTALAYDDTTDLLSVGTSSGRSDFQGLRRINNTTTAVTTAISASNGLIAEQ